MLEKNDLISTAAVLDQLLTNEEMKEVAELRGLYDMYYKVSVSLVEYRKKNNLSQKDLAKKLDVSQAMVSKLESGDYNYTIEQLWKLSKKVGFTFSITFEETLPSEIYKPIIETYSTVAQNVCLRKILISQCDPEEMGVAA